MKNLLLLLLFAFGFYGSYAQERLIKGKVLDENNNPLPGATITLKGTSVTTTSSGNGNFQIDIGNRSNAILVISFVGFIAQV